MTTHLPYPQPATPPAYPTAPPWATPAAATPQPPAPGAATPYGAPYPQHGQLLVPYPEEMVNAARPRPPSWWPVVAWTFFFGPLGAVPASRRAGRARRGRNSAAPYWVAWGVTMALGAVLGVAVAAIGVPAFLAQREAALTRVVQEKVQADVQAGAAANGTGATVRCEPAGPRDAGGLRSYRCLLALDDGRTGTLAVTADADGNWTAAGKN